MAFHTETLAAPTGGPCKGDNTERRRRAEYLVRHRFWRRLGPRYPFTLSALDHWDRAYWRRATETGDVRAAEAGVRMVQRELAAHGAGVVLDVGDARELYAIERVALCVMLDSDGKPGRVKARQVELADGRPFGVCVGSGYAESFPDPLPRWTAKSGPRTESRRPTPVRRLTPLPTVYHVAVVDETGKRRVVEYRLLGCGAVFELGTHTGGRLWAYWCDACAPRNRRVERAKRAEARAFGAASPNRAPSAPS